MKKIKKLTRRAFTLIEMVIVLGIIALLMLIIVPNLNSQRQSANAKQAAAMKTVVRDQANMYRSDKQLPDDAKVTLQDLEAANYITKDQFNQANKLQLSTDD